MAAGPSKKSKKHDRNRKWCERYRLVGQRERNKARKLLRHLKRAPWDDTARKAFEAIASGYRKGLELPARVDGPAEVRAKAGTTLAKSKREPTEAAA